MLGTLPTTYLGLLLGVSHEVCSMESVMRSGEKVNMMEEKMFRGHEGPNQEHLV